MFKFGIYYIPKEGKFYNLGSKLVGYDIRNEKLTTPLDNFKDAWNENAREYGFHLTLTDAVYINEDKLKEIENTLSMTLELFSKANKYLLEVENKPVTFWKKGGDQAALKFKLNSSVMMLHCVLASLLQTKGNGSSYSDITSKNTREFTLDMNRKIKRFWSPYVLDEFRPHFTLINPYNGQDYKKIEDNLNKIFKGIKSINIESLCLVTQNGPGQ